MTALAALPRHCGIQVDALCPMRRSPSSWAIPTSVLGDRLGRRVDVLRRVRPRAVEVPLARELAVAHDDEAVRLALAGLCGDLIELRREEPDRGGRDLLPGGDRRGRRRRARRGRDGERAASRRRAAHRLPSAHVPRRNLHTPLIRLITWLSHGRRHEPHHWSARLFSFPNPVNEVSARVVAGGVVLLSAAAFVTESNWLVALIAYGFVARVLTGPTLSPLGQLATRVITPRLHVEPKIRRRTAEALRAGHGRHHDGRGRRCLAIGFDSWTAARCAAGRS